MGEAVCSAPLCCLARPGCALFQQHGPALHTLCSAHLHGSARPLSYQMLLLLGELSVALPF